MPGRTTRRTHRLTRRPDAWGRHCCMVPNDSWCTAWAASSLSYGRSSTCGNGQAGQRGAADWRGDYTFKTPRDNRWGYGLAGGGGIALLIDRFELNFRVRYYFGYADILRNRNRYADHGIDGSENPFAQTPMRSPLDNLMISVGVNFRFNKEGFETWKPRPKRAKAPEAFTYGK